MTSTSTTAAPLPMPAAAIGLFQAVILYCVVRFGLGLEVAHPVAMVFFMMGVSLSFIAFTQAVNAFVGPAVGRVLIMALLMLQMVSAGGMYPVETTSTPALSSMVASCSMPVLSKTDTKARRMG